MAGLRINNYCLLFLKVPGRLHPIKLHYRPVVVEEQASKNEKLNPAPYIQIMHLIDEKYPSEYIHFLVKYPDSNFYLKFIFCTVAFNLLIIYLAKGEIHYLKIIYTG